MQVLGGPGSSLGPPCVLATADTNDSPSEKCGGQHEGFSAWEKTAMEIPPAQSKLQMAKNELLQLPHGRQEVDLVSYSHPEYTGKFSFLMKGLGGKVRLLILQITQAVHPLSPQESRRWLCRGLCLLCGDWDMEGIKECCQFFEGSLG